MEQTADSRDAAFRKVYSLTGKRRRTIRMYSILQITVTETKQKSLVHKD